jgi:hypothetical protein
MTPEHVFALVERIRPLLAGQHPSVQGAVLAELLGLWLGGHHPPALREAMLTHHVDAVRALMAVTGRQLHGE